MKSKLKNILFTIVSVVIVMIATSVLAFAEDEEYNYDDLYYKIVDGEAIITEIHSWGDIVIPSEIEGYKVTGIAENVVDFFFEGNITIPSSIEYIDDNAFVSDDIFSDSLYGSYIKKFIVAEDNKYYSSDEKGVLFDKTKTKLILFPKADYTTYVVPESVKVIADYAFTPSKFASITLPEGLEEIGEGAFGNCFYLESITIPDSVKTIGKNAFNGCESVEEVILGKGVMSIGEGAFGNCIYLESITIPDSVKTIGKNAFNGCESVEEVILGKGVMSIGEGAFGNCSSLWDVLYCASEEDWEKISIASDNDCLDYADIQFNYDPQAAFKCGDNASWNFDEETNTLTISGTGEMYDYETRGPWYKHIDKLIESAEINVVIEEGITAIGSNCFAEDYYGNFVRCNIVNVSLPESLRKIGGSAFSNCRLLREIIIPDNVESIGSYAFYKTSLEKVKLPEKLTRIASGTFQEAELKNIVIPDGVTYIGYYAFCDCFDLSTIVLPESVTEIHREAFAIKTGIAARLNKMGDRYLYYKGTQEQYNRIRFDVSNMSEEKKYEYGILIGNKMIYNYNIADHFHTYIFDKRVEAACETDGYKSFVCDCGDSYKITIKALDHYFLFSDIISVEKKASTTSDGLCTAKCGRKGCGKIDNKVTLRKISKVKLSSTVFYYDGKNKKPTVSVYDANNNYIDEKHYTVEYQTSCSSVGTHRLRITFKGDLYEGSVVMKYSIVLVKQNTTQVGFAWGAVSGADGYRVFYKTASGWKALGDTTKTNVIFSKLKPGTKYTFAVRAGKISAGKIIWAKDYTIIDTATKPTAPTKIVSAQNTSAIRLSWTECAGATGYRIYVKSGNTWKVALSTTENTSHTFTGLKPGAKYTLAVRPYVLAGCGVVWGDYLTYAAATVPSMPQIAAASTAKGNATVKWSAVSGAQAYQLFYKTGSGDYKLYNNYTSARTLSFNGLRSGTEYTFVARAAIKTGGGWIFSSFKPVTMVVK